MSSYPSRTKGQGKIVFQIGQKSGPCHRTPPVRGAACKRGLCVRMSSSSRSCALQQSAAGNYGDPKGKEQDNNLPSLPSYTPSSAMASHCLSLAEIRAQGPFGYREPAIKVSFVGRENAIDLQIRKKCFRKGKYAIKLFYDEQYM